MADRNLGGWRWTAEARQAQGERMRELMRDPARREAQMAGLRRASQDPEARSRNAERMREVYQDPARREKLCAAARKRYGLPDMTMAQHEVYGLARRKGCTPDEARRIAGIQPAAAPAQP